MRAGGAPAGGGASGRRASGRPVSGWCASGRCVSGRRASGRRGGERRTSGRRGGKRLGWRRLHHEGGDLERGALSRTRVDARRHAQRLAHDGRVSRHHPTLGGGGVESASDTAHYAHSGVAARRPLRALQKDTWLNTGTWHKILESGTVSKESGHVLSPLSLRRAPGPPPA